jgi:hypothetical protein
MLHTQSSDNVYQRSATISCLAAVTRNEAVLCSPVRHIRLGLLDHLDCGYQLRIVRDLLRHEGSFPASFDWHPAQRRFGAKRGRPHEESPPSHRRTVLRLQVINGQKHPLSEFNGLAPRHGFEPAFTARENSSSQASPKGFLR